MLNISLLNQTTKCNGSDGNAEIDKENTSSTQKKYIEENSMSQNSRRDFTILN